MESSTMSIVPFAESTLSRSVRMIHQVVDGLSEAQVFWQPTPECNSIGWLAWHLTRRKDYYSSKLVDEEQTWVSGGWSKRFGMNPEETGTGHTLEEVKDFHSPLDFLLDYVESANVSAVDRVAKATEESMNDEVELDAGRGMKPRHNIWNPMLSDCLQHTGQIAYIRGMVTGKGWFGV